MGGIHGVISKALLLKNGSNYLITDGIVGTRGLKPDQ